MAKALRAGGVAGAEEPGAEHGAASKEPDAVRRQQDEGLERSIAKRRSAIAHILKSADYKRLAAACASGADFSFRPPDPEDNTVTKRNLEKQIVVFRMDLRRFCDEWMATATLPAVIEAFGTQSDEEPSEVFAVSAQCMWI